MELRGDQKIPHVFVYKSPSNKIHTYSHSTGDTNHAMGLDPDEITHVYNSYESDDTSVDSIPVTLPSIEPQLTYIPCCTTLTLRVAMYDIMVTGIKSVEYRPNTPYYRNRFYNTHGMLKINMIKFGKAYLKCRPFFYASIDHITIVHEVDEWYGNVHVRFPYRSDGYFAIHLVQETISLWIWPWILYDHYHYTLRPFLCEVEQKTSHLDSLDSVWGISFSTGFNIFTR